MKIGRESHDVRLVFQPTKSEGESTFSKVLLHVANCFNVSGLLRHREFSICQGLKVNICPSRLAGGELEVSNFIHSP